MPGTMPAGRREVSLALKVSNHYEPNDQYHMNIRIVPSVPRFQASPNQPSSDSENTSTV
jgi:hypothetical protein